MVEGIVWLNKDSSEIIAAFFRHQNAYFGQPLSVLTNNRQDFNNQYFWQGSKFEYSYWDNGSSKPKKQHAKWKTQ